MRTTVTTHRGANLFLPLLSLVLAACSPAKPAPLPQYRKLDTSCANMNLSSAEIDGRTFKSLLHCFNKYGALEPVEKLFAHLDDSETDGLLRVANELYLQNPTRLYELEHTYRTLDARGTLTGTLEDMGHLSRAAQAVTASLRMISSDQPAVRDRVLLLAEKLGKAWQGDVLPRAFDDLLLLERAKAFRSLESELALGKKARALPELAAAIDRALLAAQTPGREGFLPALDRLAKSGDLFRVLDQVGGQSESELAERSPRLGRMLEKMLAENGRILGDLGEMFRIFEVECIKRSEVAIDPGMHLLQTIATLKPSDVPAYLRRHHLLTIAALNSFCDFPDTLTRGYGSLLDLADSPAILPASELIQSSFAVATNTGTSATASAPPGAAPAPRVPPMAHFLVQLFVDPALKELLPPLAELADRGTMTDLLLTLDLPRPEDRAGVVQALDFLLESSRGPSNGPSNGMGETVSDAAQNLILQAGPEKLADLLSELGDAMEKPEPMLLPALDRMRSIYFLNDTHPVAEPLLSLLASARARPELFSTLFKLSGYPELRDSLELLGRMSRHEDGRLKELMDAAFLLTHRFAARGPVPIATTDASPAPQVYARHDWNASELFARESPVTDTSVGKTPESCRLVDLGFAMDDTSRAHHQQFEKQWDEFERCLTSDGSHQDVRAAIDFLRERKTPAGQSFLSLDINLAKAFSLTHDEAKTLIDAWARAMDDGRYFRALDAAALWIDHRVLRPLLDWAAPIRDQAWIGFRRLEKTAASVLLRPDFTTLLRSADRLSEKNLLPAPAAPSLLLMDPALLNETEKRVREQECVKDPSTAQARARQVVSDYEQALTSWEAPDGRPRHEWTLADLHAKLEPLLREINEPAVQKAVIRFLRYFTLPAGATGPDRERHYPAAYLLQWFYDRSIDLQPITYYYGPQDDSPRTRYVNTLDRLELVLINSDSEIPSAMLSTLNSILKMAGEPLGVELEAGTNLGKKFLTDIALSWGDEPEAIWPDEVREWAAQNHRRPPTLSQTIASIHGTQSLLELVLGFPQAPPCFATAPRARCESFAGIAAPGCYANGLPDGAFDAARVLKRELYNIRQVGSVLDENGPDSPDPRMRNGLKVLRDLFYVLYSSTPAADRGFLKGTANHLTVATDIARLGVDRWVARELRPARRGDPALLDFVKAAIEGSQSSALPWLLDRLFTQDPSHRLIWTMAEHLFTLADQSSPAQMAAMKQLGFYLVADIRKLRVVDAGMQSLADVLNLYQGFLEKEPETLDRLARSTEASSFARALYEVRDRASIQVWRGFSQSLLADRNNAVDLATLFYAISENPAASQAWSTLQARYGRLQEDPLYRALDPFSLRRNFLDFAEERSTDPRSRELAQKLRHELADQLRNAGFDPWVELMSREPDGVYRLGETLSHSIHDGELKDFFSYVREGLKSPD